MNNSSLEIVFGISLIVLEPRSASHFARRTRVFPYEKPGSNQRRRFGAIRQQLYFYLQIRNQLHSHAAICLSERNMPNHIVIT